MRLVSSVLGLLLWTSLPAQPMAVLPAHPGPSDNGLAGGGAMLFDLHAATDVVFTGFTVATAVWPGSSYQVTIHTRSGTALGGPANAGPGSSSAGWTEMGTFAVVQGEGEVSLPVQLPPVPIAAGTTLGVLLVFPASVNLRYVGLDSPPIQTYSDVNLAISTGDVRGNPFTPTGVFFSSRALVGSILYRAADPVLPAHPGPTNNYGNAGYGMFFDLQSDTGAVVSGLTTSTGSAAGTPFEIDVHTRQGTALGNVDGASTYSSTGPATSYAGWTFRGTVAAVQANDGMTRPIRLPPIEVPAGQTIGVGLVYRGAQPHYRGTGAPPLSTFGTSTLSLTTGDALSIPFSPGSSVFTSRALVGSLAWHPAGLKFVVHPGPANNTNDPGTAQFFDVIGPSDAAIRGLRVATDAVPGASFQVRVYTRDGTALGGGLSSGPGSSSAGWTLHSTSTVLQPPTGELSEPFVIPEIPLAAGQARGIALVVSGASPRYRGLGVAPMATYEQHGIQVTTGEARTLPFTAEGRLFTGRQLVGELYLRVGREVFGDGFE